MSTTKSTSSNTAKTLALDTPLQFIKGVGPARASYFQRKGILSIQDALFYFPRRYEDRSKIFSPAEVRSLPEGTHVVVAAKIQSTKDIPLRNRKQKMFELTALGEAGDALIGTWFHTYKGMKEKFKLGSWAVFTGPVKHFRGNPQIVHPDVELVEAKPDASQIAGKSLSYGRIVPIYSRTEGLTQRLIRDVCFRCLESGLPLLPEILPEYLRKKHGLLGNRQALAEMHFPATLPGEASLTPAARRLVFEEFFKFQLVLLMDRAGIKPEPGIPLTIKNRAAQKMRANLPYKLTGAQERAVAEILSDAQKATAMNRILQGDVGSGKTLVAFLCLAEAAENKLQGCLLVPTEILAEQHFENAKIIFAGTGINVGFISGSLPRAEKLAAQEKIRSGAWDIVIGTHALIQEAVEWKNLGFVVIDEQHRFGVRQRTFLKEKSASGKLPHILTMTATPIPRSLALSIFGELAVSTIDELPPGRTPIITKVLRGNERDRMYKLFHHEVEQGRQAYLVYPLVSDSDKEGMERLKSVESEFARLQEGVLHKLRLAIVHGQMPASERNQVMRDFKNKKYDVLIATTVIEVGVDVPNATVMAIENSERFGLSQLHQLRGRVGRGAHKSYCVLITETPPPGFITSSLANEDAGDEDNAWKRLAILEKSQNGFVIAEEDLKIRGPGDFFGTKQSGSPTFQLADLSRDMDLLELARVEAHSLYDRDPMLAEPEHSELKKYFHSVLETAAATLKSG